MTFRDQIFYLTFTALFLALYSHSASAEDHFLSFVPEESPYFMYYEADETISTNLSEALKLVASKSEAESIEKAQPGFERLFASLGFDVLNAAKQRDLTPLGLPQVDQMKVGVYGLGLWPVISIAVNDQKKAISWIVKRAKQANLKLRPSGNKLQFVPIKPIAEQVEMWMSPRGSKWINFSLVPREQVKRHLAFVSGEVKSKSSIMTSMTLTKLKESVGLKLEKQVSFFSIQALFKTLLGQGEGTNKTFGWYDDSIIKATPQPCITEYMQLAEAIPYAVFGQKTTVGDQTEYIGLLKFSESIAQVTHQINPKSAYELPFQDAVIHFNFGVNVRGLIDGAQRFIQYRVQSPFTCPNLAKLFSTERLQMASSQLMLIPPFAYDLGGVSVSLDKLNPTPSGSAIINAKNVQNLLNLARSMKPDLAKIELPAVDAGPQALKPPPGKRPLPFEVNVELKRDAIGLSSSPQSTSTVSKVLSAPPSTEPSFFSFVYDLNVILDSFTQYIAKTREITHKLKMADHRAAVLKAEAEGLTPPPPPKMDSNNEEINSLIKAYRGPTRIGARLRFTEHGLELSVQTSLNAN